MMVEGPEDPLLLFVDISGLFIFPQEAVEVSSHNHFRLMHILRGGRNGLTRHYKIRVSLPALSNLRVGEREKVSSLKYDL